MVTVDTAVVLQALSGTEREKTEHNRSWILQDYQYFIARFLKVAVKIFLYYWVWSFIEVEITISLSIINKKRNRVYQIHLFIW